jgi:predicted permease
MALVLHTVLPVFAIVALGWWVAGRRRLDLATISDVALMVASPSLLFSLLSQTTLDAERLGALAGGTVAMAAGTALLAVAYTRALGLGRGFVLPVVFFNGGNMGLACSRLAFGEPGLEAGAVVFVTIATLTSSFGIWIAKGSDGLAEALRMPLLWGSVGGLFVAATGLAPPRIVMEPIEMLGAMAIPLMLLNLGLQLRALELSDLHHSVAAVALRMGGGLACMALYTQLFGITGIDRQVLMLYSVMPGAVINAVLAQRYASDETLVASAVVLGTLLAVLSIPAVLLVVG